MTPAGVFKNEGPVLKAPIPIKGLPISFLTLAPHPPSPWAPNAQPGASCQECWVRKVSTRTRLRLSPLGTPLFSTTNWKITERAIIGEQKQQGHRGVLRLVWLAQTPSSAHPHHGVTQPRLGWSLSPPLGSHQGLTTPLPEHKFIWHLDEMVLTAS